jgi:transcriptional regulator with XRE-family HTH domain
MQTRRLLHMAKPNGARLRALRVEADWSSSELAEMLGLEPGSWRNIEGGKGRIPMLDRRIHRAARLFTAQLGRPITYEYIVGENNDGTPSTPPGGDPEPKPKPPPGRKERGGKGPKRENGRAA